MDKHSTNLNVPWLKIIHAGFNAGFRWTISSIVLGLLAFLMSDGLEASIRVILWSPVVMFAMGFLFASLGLFYICTCQFKWARWMVCLFWFLVAFVNVGIFVLLPHVCLFVCLRFIVYQSGAWDFSGTNIFWVTCWTIATLWWSWKLVHAKWIKSIWGKCLAYVNDTEAAKKKLIKAIPKMSKKQPLLPNFFSKKKRKAANS